MGDGNGWCRHYTGLASGASGDPLSIDEGRKCQAGVEYRSIEPRPHLDHWPCFIKKYHYLCSRREDFTAEEIAERDRRVADFINKMTAFDRRETEDCPHCKQHVNSLRQVGRCVYASPCGCRVWQGKVPEAWKS